MLYNIINCIVIQLIFNSGFIFNFENFKATQQYMGSGYLS